MFESIDLVLKICKTTIHYYTNYSEINVEGMEEPDIAKQK